MGEIKGQAWWNEVKMHAATLVCPSVMTVGGRQWTKRVRELQQGNPVIGCVVDSKYGRACAIFLPIDDEMLFTERQSVPKLAVDAIEFAYKNNIRSVSMAAMIPASLRYGVDLVEPLRERLGADHSMKITTGHATTVTAFGMSIDRVLQCTDRRLGQEKVAVVGLGSIGAGVLRLIVKRLVHPVSFTLVELEDQKQRVDLLRKEIIDAGYKGDVTVILIAKKSKVPMDTIKDCTLILGATSTYNVIDIEALNPGVIVIDDSFPYCFDPKKALNRIKEKGDIMISIAGSIENPDVPLSLTPVFISGAGAPVMEDHMLDKGILMGVRICHPTLCGLTGCYYSAILTPYFNLPCTVGVPTEEQILAHYDTLKANGFTGAPPHLHATIIDSESITKFKDTYGKKASL